MLRWASTPVLLGAVAFAATACSVLLSVPEDQCRVDGDCSGRGFAGAICSSGICVSGGQGDARSDAPSDPVWGCVGSVSWPVQDDTRSVRTESQLRGLLSNTPIAGSTVRACNAIDVACAHPVATATTDAQGIYRLMVPYAFRGFLEATHTSADLLPLLLPFTAPIVRDESLADGTPPVHVATAQELSGLLGVVSRTLEPETGHVFGLAIDCQGNPVAGVVLEQATPTLPQSLTYYVDETGLPNTTQKASSTTGQLGIVNLPPGPVTFRYARAGGERIGTVTLQIRKGAITAAALPPTPLVAGQP